VLKRVEPWPNESPGAANAWLVFVTTKPPKWRDPIMIWPAGPPALGVPHEGFYYPDPIGFWAEVRRWATTLLGLVEPGVSITDALAVSALFHIGEEPSRIAWARLLLQPKVTLFLDEAAWTAASIRAPSVPFSIPDPHRRGVVYEGWWARTDDGTVLGKSPQHPAAHQLYEKREMDRFLGAAPVLRGD
jgi:hypothetical protein